MSGCVHGAVAYGVAGGVRRLKARKGSRALSLLSIP
jgi:hypothetical protein